MTMTMTLTRVHAAAMRHQNTVSARDNMSSLLWFIVGLFHRDPNMRRCPDIQQFWRQSLCSCGHRTMEQSSIAPKRGGLTIQSIRAVAKDIFVWIVGPRRSVNYFNCAA